MPPRISLRTWLRVRVGHQHSARDLEGDTDAAADAAGASRAAPTCWPRGCRCSPPSPTWSPPSAVPSSGPSAAPWQTASFSCRWPVSLRWKAVRARHGSRLSSWVLVCPCLPHFTPTAQVPTAPSGPTPDAEVTALHKLLQLLSQLYRFLLYNKSPCHSEWSAVWVKP